MPTPSKPGYYWREGRNEDDLLVRQVVEVGPLIRTEPDELFYWVPGDVGAIYTKADSEHDTKWFGPIHEAHELIVLLDELSESFSLLSEAGISCESLPEGIKTVLALVSGLTKQT